MGKVYEGARLDRPGSADEVNGGRTFRSRRGDRFTRWDWVKWWRKRSGIGIVYCPAGVGTSGQCAGREALAVLHARNARSARFQLAARTRLSYWADLQE